MRHKKIILTREYIAAKVLLELMRDQGFRLKIAEMAAVVAMTYLYPDLRRILREAFP
jgi:hypothetical protein